MSQMRAATKPMTPYEVAKLYVDKQLAGMKANGLQTEKVSAAGYQAMIEQVMKAVKA